MHVSQSNQNMICYDQLDYEVIKNHDLFINTTPLGTFPSIDDCEDVPY